MTTLEHDLEAVCEYVQRLPIGEIFSLQDWLASRELDYLFALQNRIHKAHAARHEDSGHGYEMALALAFTLMSLESSLACAEMGRMRFLAEDRSEKTPAALDRLQGVLLVEALRRIDVLEVRRLSMVPGEPLWLQLTEVWRQCNRYMQHPGVEMLLPLIPIAQWGSVTLGSDQD